MNENIEKQFTRNELERILKNINGSLDNLYKSYNNFNDGYSDEPAKKINEAYANLEEKLVKAKNIVIDIINRIDGEQ